MTTTMMTITRKAPTMRLTMRMKFLFGLEGGALMRGAVDVVEVVLLVVVEVVLVVVA